MTIGLSTKYVRKEREKNSTAPFKVVSHRNSISETENVEKPDSQSKEVVLEKVIDGGSPAVNPEKLREIRASSDSHSAQHKVYTTESALMIPGTETGLVNFSKALDHKIIANDGLPYAHQEKFEIMKDFTDYLGEKLGNADESKSKLLPIDKDGNEYHEVNTIDGKQFLLTKAAWKKWNAWMVHLNAKGLKYRSNLSINELTIFEFQAKWEKNLDLFKKMQAHETE